MADLVNNPVDLTETSPTEPEVRTIEDIQNVPRRDRIRFWRRIFGHPDSISFYVNPEPDSARLTFDGTTSYIDSDSNVNLVGASTSLRIEVCFNLNDTSGEQSLLRNSNNGIRISINNGFPYISILSGTIAATSFTISANTNYRMIVDKNGTSCDVTVITLDGSAATKKENVAGTCGNTNQNSIMGIGGRGGTGAGFSDGEIWDAKIIEDGVLLHHWAIDEGTGETAIIDYGTAGVDGTIVGSGHTWSKEGLTHDGTTAETAYKDFSAIQALYDGDATALDNKTIGIAAGTKINAAGSPLLSATGTKNLTIRSYGSGDRPLLENKYDGGVAPTEFTEVTPSTYYTIPSYNGTTAPMSLVVDGVWFTEAPSQTIAAAEAQDNCYYWDSATGTMHVYTTTDLTAATIIDTAAAGATLELGTTDVGGAANDVYVENLTLKDLDFAHGKECVTVANGYSGLVIDNVRARYTHDNGGSTTSMPFFTSSTREDGADSDGMVVRNSEFAYSNDQLWLLRDEDGGSFTDCSFHDSANVMFEMKGNVSNFTWNRCKMYSSSQTENSGVFKTTADSPSTYTNIKVINSLFHASHREYQKNTVTPSGNGRMGQRVLNTDPSVVTSNWKFVNCTFYNESLPTVALQSGTSHQVRIINSILALNERTATGFGTPYQGFYLTGTAGTTDASTFAGTSTAWGDDVDTNNNLYYRYNATNRFCTTDTRIEPLTTWQAFTQSPDANSIEGEAGVPASRDPLFVEKDVDGLLGFDLHVQAGSGAIGLGSQLDSGGAVDPDVPTVDLDGNARDMDNITAGCYQYSA